MEEKGATNDSSHKRDPFVMTERVKNVGQRPRKTSCLAASSSRQLGRLLGLAFDKSERSNENRNCDCRQITRYGRKHA